MANKKVALVRKCKTPGGWRRYPVVMSANGKVKPDAVTVDGLEAILPRRDTTSCGPTSGRRWLIRAGGRGTRPKP